MLSGLEIMQYLFFISLGKKKGIYREESRIVL
jgi:hypothetical protein